ncbi:MAG: hypothetical protein L6435_04415, partial [Anaerolineae bacterium]|nr:hypothetical protein [Anaerolineae bacterium]
FDEAAASEDVDRLTNDGATDAYLLCEVPFAGEPVADTEGPVDDQALDSIGDLLVQSIAADGKLERCVHSDS